MANPFVINGVLPSSTFKKSEIEIAQAAQRKADGQPMLLSSISDDDESILSAMAVTADKNLRSFAAALVIEWAKSGEHDYDSLEALIVGAVNEDDDELSDDDKQEVEELINAVSQFILDITDMSAKDLQTLFEEENDTLAEKAGDAISDAIKSEPTDELIANYAEKQALLLSAVKKVVRDGKTVLIKKRTRKRRMSPAQKAALKKARKKSNSSAARANRKKSNRLRKSKGM
ncbi:hypothetical protein HWV00_21210 (plasmid) [Moritella sp. 24]|uniref:hypothetical protein n=1 Tax=Moritella sp. 24 TaxID=2746230 RepID=UPI001BA609F1|nr:hypothetical protein [Moritella sp. 24]QUM78795.1 hypothetical protein HWV00_21210 [Moritella sp. 24]